MERFKPFWESSDIKEEILVFVEENGVISANLAFDNPQNVVLRDRTGRTFEKDKDYLQRGNKVIVISEDIPYLKQANHCIECGICQSQCPMSVDIPKEMRRIDELVESLKVEELRK